MYQALEIALRQQIVFVSKFCLDGYIQNSDSNIFPKQSYECYQRRTSVSKS